MAQSWSAYLAVEEMLQEPYGSAAHTNGLPKQPRHSIHKYTQHVVPAQTYQDDGYLMDEVADEGESESYDDVRDYCSQVAQPLELASTSVHAAKSDQTNVARHGASLQTPIGMTFEGNLPQIQEKSTGDGGVSVDSLMRKILFSGSIPHDIRLVADDGEMHAHRYMLIRRSHYFDCRLQGFARLDPWEAVPKQRVEGIRVDILRHVLTFVYTDLCDFQLASATAVDIATCFELLDASIRFGLKGLETSLLQQVLAPLALTLPDALQYRAQLKLMTQRVVDEPIATSETSYPIASDTVETSQDSPMGLTSLPAHGYTLVLDEVLNDSAQQLQSLDDGCHSLDSDQNTETMEKHNKLAATIQDSGATTLMIRNLPRHVKQRRFIKELDDTGFAGMYDYAYLPSSFGNGSEPSGLGYAFVNFETWDAIPRFVRLWHGSRHFRVAKNELPLTVTAAEHQGKEINVRMWLRKGGRVRNPDLRPFVKEAGILIGLDSKDDYQTYVDQLISSMPSLKSTQRASGHLPDALHEELSVTSANRNPAEETLSAEPKRSAGTTRLGPVPNRDSYQ